MRDVAIVSYAETTSRPGDPPRDDAEMLQAVITRALGDLPRNEIGFTVSGSCDFLVGRPFSFVMALDAVGAWPPISESHLEMDGAFALYEAWVRLQHGDIDTALVYAFGRPSLGKLRDVMVMQLDPYCVAPLHPDAVSLAALQARALVDAGGASEREMAEIAIRRLGLSARADELLEQPYVASPLRRHDIAAVCDGAAAAVLAAGDRARELSARPAWIRGIDHRVEPQSLGARDLWRSASTEQAARRAGVASGSIDVAEIHAPFSHQEILLRHALGLPGEVAINPSGGALGKNPMMVAGLARLGHAAQAIHEGRARRAVAHATSGPCLQQNLVCVLEAAQ